MLAGKGSTRSTDAMAHPILRPRTASLAAAALAIGLGACGDLTGPGGAPPSAGPSAPIGDAKVLIDWTLGGAAPSAAGCAAVDHLQLVLVSDVDQVGIAPIPCTLTRFRYDNLPGGANTVQLFALDAAGCQLAQSPPVSVTLSATLPATPTRLALPAIHAGPCH
jgi:hypothetical protein